MKRKQILWHEIINTGEPVETASIKIDADESAEAADMVKLDPNMFDESSASNFCNSTQNCDFTNNRDISADKTTNNTTAKPLGNNFRSKTKEIPDRIKKPEHKSLISCLVDFQSEKTSLLKMKLEWERQKHVDEMEIRKQKITLEEEKTKAEIELRKKELELKARQLELDERLKVLEMEKDERIKKFEIEMKLKYQNNSP